MTRALAAPCVPRQGWRGPPAGRVVAEVAFAAVLADLEQLIAGVGMAQSFVHDTLELSCQAVTWTTARNAERMLSEILQVLRPVRTVVDGLAADSPKRKLLDISGAEDVDCLGKPDYDDDIVEGPSKKRRPMGQQD